MGPTALLLLFVPILGTLAFIFGKNVRGGLCSGEIWAKNVRINRSDQPIGFQITVVVYSMATLICISGVGLIAYVLATN